ncbi:hypothetical protein ABW20_dc0102257 [Dactylellina cionopaga]|nr:hypothetical protein ABW20_dc0102257 [Dactylellina cionopaga]
MVNWWYLVASVWSYKRRSWGGPRVRRRVGEIVQADHKEEESSDGLPELSDRERDAIREAALPWRTLSGRFVPARVNEDGLYHRSELDLPLSGRSSVVLPQLLISDAASITTRNSDYYGDFLVPPMPGRRNRHSGLSSLSFDSEVRRLYAPAQTFLRTDSDGYPDLEFRYTAPAPYEDYGVAAGDPSADCDIHSQQSLQFQVPNYHGDLGEVTFAQIHQAQYDDGLPHAISDDSPQHHYRSRSVQESIDLLYPPSMLQVDRSKRAGSPDSWVRDDDAAFSAAGLNSPPGNDPFGTPPSFVAQPSEASSSKRGKGKLLKKKPAPVEIDDSLVRGRKSGFFDFLKKH